MAQLPRVGTAELSAPLTPLKGKEEMIFQPGRSRSGAEKLDGADSREERQRSKSHLVVATSVSRVCLLFAALARRWGRELIYAVHEEGVGDRKTVGTCDGARGNTSTPGNPIS